ncbi:adenylate kinase [Prochlorococcus sp. MIT 1223]|uniref:adenylate kinase n=1 Tax=Prochlorococcus sp. MIT 1223 TaxID=3096217 RepID=UPI002A74ABC8|nr:adenylate kinase [Prochlorococcus sp. MIT 1223]
MKKRLLFLGPPGAGKGTQASIFCKNNGFLHLSTGDLLRQEVSAKTPLGREAALIMNKGELVSDSIVLSIVQKNLSNQDKSWLLDGFPRNLSQAKSLERLLKQIEQPIDAVISIEINDEVLIKRLLARGRDDDNEDVIKNRLVVYREKTEPLIGYYASRGLIKSIEGDAEIDIVANLIQKALN